MEKSHLRDQVAKMLKLDVFGGGEIDLFRVNLGGEVESDLRMDKV